MVGNQQFFTHLSPCSDPHTVRIENGSCSQVTGHGSVRLTPDICLQSVLFVPDLHCNLLSVSRLNSDLKCTTKFFAHSCVFQDLASGMMIGSAELCGGLYLLKMNVSPRGLTATYPTLVNSAPPLILNKDNAVLLWHYRLGHPNFLYLGKLFPSLFNNKSSRSFQCDICQLSKHTRSTFTPQRYKPHIFLLYTVIFGAPQMSQI